MRVEERIGEVQVCDGHKTLHPRQALSTTEEMASSVRCGGANVVVLARKQVVARQPILERNAAKVRRRGGGVKTKQ